MKRPVILAFLLGSLVGVFLLAACGGGGGGESFNTSCFPLEIPGTDGGWANIAFDGDGNLIIPHNVNDEVLSVDRHSCTLSTLATVTAGGQLYTVGYHPGTDTIYAGDTGGNIYAVNPSSGANSLLVNVGTFINALVAAPEGFGSFGGQLLAALSNGVLVAVDTASAATTEVADTGENLSDVEFAANGTLYGLHEGSAEVITISADGMTSVFATGFSAPDGIAVDGVNGRLLISDYGPDTLYAVQISDGAKTALGSYDFDGGWYPSGLAFDGVQTVLMATGEDDLIIEALTF